MEENRDAKIQARLTEQENETVKLICQENNMTVSDYVRSLLIKDINDRLRVKQIAEQEEKKKQEAIKKTYIENQVDAEGNKLIINPQIFEGTSNEKSEPLFNEQERKRNILVVGGLAVLSLFIWAVSSIFASAKKYKSKYYQNTNYR